MSRTLSTIAGGAIGGIPGALIGNKLGKKKKAAPQTVNNYYGQTGPTTQAATGPSPSTAGYGY